MINFPRQQNRYICLTSAVTMNTDIYIHMEDDTCTVFTVENKDLKATLKTLEFLGYRNAMYYRGVVVSDDVLFSD